MVTKSPINILQEYCVSRNMPLPRYDFENRTQTISTFACFCFCDDKQLEAVSTSKKEAKTRVAEMMLAELGVSAELSLPKRENKVVVTTPSGPANYVGLLNEYCSGRGLPYPEYCEDGVDDGCFSVKCKHGGLTGLGCGRTKKEAKQSAARDVLQQLNLTSSNKKSNIDQAIKKYKNLPLNAAHSPKSPSTKILSPKREDETCGGQPPDKTPPVSPKPSHVDEDKPSDEAPTLSSAELEAKLEGMGVQYDVQKTGDEPVVLVFLEKDTKTVFHEMGGTGDSYEIVLRLLLDKAVRHYESKKKNLGIVLSTRNTFSSNNCFF